MEKKQMNNQRNQYPLGGYNQNQYNQQGMPIGNQMYNMNQPQGHSGLAIASFVLALLGCTSLIGLILGIVDVVVNKQRKHGLSIAAIVISVVWLVLSVGVVWGSTIDGSNTKVNSSQAIEESTEHTKVGGITGFSNDSDNTDFVWDGKKTLDDNLNNTTEESDYYNAISNAEYSIRFDLIRQEGDINDIKVDYDKSKLDIQEWRIKETKFDTVSYLYGGQGNSCYQYYAKIPAGKYVIKTDVEYLQNVDLVKNEFYKCYNGGDFMFNKTGISQNARCDENTYTIDTVTDSELVTADSSIIVSTKFVSTQKEDIKEIEENHEFVTVTEDSLINIELFRGYAAENGTISFYKVQ